MVTVIGGPSRNDGRGPFGPIRKGPTPVTSMPMKTWKLEFPTPQTADTRTVASSSFDLNSLISKLPKDHLTVVTNIIERAFGITDDYDS
uniref:Uncharacterized protein n=1 Tax=Romanomermis culicivorax TaxID=13658 RepID=A0A915I713_ROMCU